MGGSGASVWRSGPSPRARLGPARQPSRRRSVWPVPILRPRRSPAPRRPRDQRFRLALGLLPFVTGVVPLFGGGGDQADRDNADHRCGRPTKYSVGLETRGDRGVAGRKFSPNGGQHGRARAGAIWCRVSTLFGEPRGCTPPKLPILPTARTWSRGAAVPVRFDVPKPVSRVQPQYPPGAEAGHRGQGVGAAGGLSSGRVTPVAINGRRRPAGSRRRLWSGGRVALPQPEGPGQRFFYESGSGSG